MNLTPRQEQLLAELRVHSDPQERLAWLVEQAHRHPGLPAALRHDAHRVPGCLAQLWLVVEWREGRAFFQSDSDAQLVRAVAGLVADFFSGCTPTEILAAGLQPLAAAGLERQLTPNRRNAVARIWDRVRAEAEGRERAPGAPPSTAVPVPGPRFCDAHNHLQDARFADRQDTLIEVARAAGVVRMVVNGVAESDWPAVAELARRHPDLILPSFGWHPWHVHEREDDWLPRLTAWLDQVPGAFVGEIGLDRWKPGLGYDGQEEVFSAQLALAAARNLPVTIHCLQVWGRLHELLGAAERPARGFVLHSFGGPVELIEPLARLGAWFSFPGHFLHERKARQREAFRHVPPDRLLVETDAPDQLPPDGWNRFPLPAHDGGRALHHPANLASIHAGLAGILGEPVADLTARVGVNFGRCFGR